MIVLLLVIVPFLLGSALLVTMKQKYCPGLSYAIGWLVCLALFEMIAVPATFADASLTQLTVAVNICLSVLSILAGGFILHRRNVFKEYLSQMRFPKCNIFMLSALALIGIQVIISIFAMHTDTDDAYYIGTATTSLSTDTLFKYEPDTGLVYYSRPLRYIFSALMLFWAYLSKMTGIHPLILTHSIVSVILLIMSYGLWWYASRYFFQKENQRWLFLIFLSFINIFGYTSVYTQSSFLLFRIWQGKAFLPNIIFPMLLILAMMINKNPKKYRLWILVFITALAACCCSSMSVPLGMISIAAITLALVWKHKDLKMLACGIVSCLPCVLIGAAYLLCSF